MLNAKTAVIEDVFADPRIPYDAYLPTFVKSLIMTPVGERHVAAMGAYWKDVRSFTEEEVETVQNFAAMVGESLSDLLAR
jgi:two-component system CheB/CheR fusion protein